jgi:regulator of sirC expression with transglutaminase-like and TPR domain
MITTKSEIESLLFLLEDPNPFVRESVKKRFEILGENCIPILDEMQSSLRSGEKKDSLRRLIRQITYSGIEQEFINVLEGGLKTPKALEASLLVISRLENPTLRTEIYTRALEKMADEIDFRIRYAVTPKEQMQILLTYVFQEKDFRGCSDDYLNPLHTYLHTVIDSRIGIPLTLSLIVIFLARRLDLPFYGVNMPLHFLLRFQNESESVLIDPFNKGGIVSVDQCYSFLKNSGITPDHEHFRIASEQEMLIRFIRNLINGYDQQKEDLQKHDLNKLLSILEAFTVE